MNEKDKILKYLQNNALYLSKKFPNLLDAKFESKPNRMLLVFEEEVPKNVNDVLKGLDFKFETTIGILDQNSVVTPKDGNLKAWQERYKNKREEVFIEKAEEAISPNSRNAKKVTAYEARKKRHSNVKVAK